MVKSEGTDPVAVMSAAAAGVCNDDGSNIRSKAYSQQLENAKTKRKKTSRACIHCQKSHLTCDDGRPCKRCIAKNCADSCTDGVRKKAKYLRDVEEEVLQSENNRWNSVFNPTAAIKLPAYLPPTSPDALSGGANAATSQQPSPASSLQTQNATTMSSLLNPLPEEATQFAAVGLSPNFSKYDFGSKAVDLEYSILSNILQGPIGSDGEAFAMSTPESDSPSTIPWNTQSLTSLASNPNQRLRGSSDSPAQIANSPVEPETHPEEVYSRVTAPYPYTQGYHSLIAYLRRRFDRRHLIHMARAMAAYRPSFIATTKTLKEEDLIFMEKCFQRTLLEFEKFIAVSGTPTVVWRRTGQIAAVGKEFCMLTEWPRDRLLNQQTFIVELLDDKSVTSYFDLFSRLAFGDSRGVTMSECTLIKPSGQRVPAACTWTVKRDVFDIPMMIIGNFLPIL